MQTFDEYAAQQEQPAWEPSCTDCEDSGLVDDGDRDRAEYWPCSCPIGRALAAVAKHAYEQAQVAA